MAPLLAFAVVGRGTGLRSSFVPGSLLGMTSCVSQISSVPPVISSIFSWNLVGPYIYLALPLTLACVQSFFLPIWDVDGCNRTMSPGQSSSSSLAPLL